MILQFNVGAFFKALLFGASKVVAGLLVLSAPILNPQPLSVATSTPANPWAVPTRLNVGEIVSTLNPVKPAPKPTPLNATKPAGTAGTPAPVPAPSTPSPAPAPTPVPAPTPAPIATPQPPAVAEPSVKAEDLNAQVRSATVNVLCLTEPGNPLRSVSGSGVLIDSRGVVLTNAHVVSALLLKDYPSKNSAECIIRTGSPARALYTARLLYISKTWVAENANQLASSMPMGTGEGDYAFLLITGRTDPSAALPSSFPYLPMSSARVSVGDQMFLSAYPASLLGSISTETKLYSTAAYAAVGEVYSFDNARRADLFSVGGTIVAQGGSSGGAAVRMTDGTLAGIFVTAVEAASTGASDLRALSIAYINASLYAQGEGGITGELSGELSAKADAFESGSAPALKQVILSALGR